MCLHNALRDNFILDPVPLQKPNGEWYWDPLSGATGNEFLSDPHLPLKGCGGGRGFRPAVGRRRQIEGWQAELRQNAQIFRRADGICGNCMAGAVFRLDVSGIRL
jgi:hypothetical protein